MDDLKPHGEQPIDPQYKEEMRALATAMDTVFNGEKRGAARETGFVLLVFPFGNIQECHCNYISNGANRRDMAKLLREMAVRFEAFQ